MNFGKAIEALEEGKRIQRSSWGNDGKFVFKQVPSEIHKDIVPKMQSLPAAVKAEFERRFSSELNQINAIYYTDQLALVNESNLITGYSPSSSDTLAVDWVVMD